MATKTNNCTKYEMRAVIRFLYHEGVKLFEIYSRMKTVYGDKLLFHDRFFEWVRKFKSCIESLDDAPRPGAPVKVSDDATTWAIDEMIQNDRYISIRVISAKLNLSYGSVQKKHYKTFKSFLEHYEIEGGGFLDRIVTGDESWIHHHIPDSKRSSSEWHHKGSPTPKKPRKRLLLEKYSRLFWDSKGCILEDYLPKDQTFNSIAFSELLEKI
ncbi:hypothetical protein LAZ67_1007147 [Cordylochernes scorpioides]|uniref:Mos1 transposase HTH domain-containing protein n=1 Tax=Cordylochernes scorpioides TaxID=51811 RepID=A0ABY6JZ33_9ARAC|nr:hypothetical protein LAZ67_1007147 [Cordylochernes scorpioides]